MIKSPVSAAEYLDFVSSVFRVGGDPKGDGELLIKKLAGCLFKLFSDALGYLAALFLVGSGKQDDELLSSITGNHIDLAGV